MEQEILEMEESPFWIDLSTDDIGTEIIDRCDRFDRYIDATGQRASWIKKWRYYYGHFNNDQLSDTEAIRMVGDNGEFLFMAVNHFRSLAEQRIVSVTTNPPNFQVNAANTDTRSIQLAEMGNGLLDYYTRTTSLKSKLTKSVEHALIYDAGYLMVEWDPTLGSLDDAVPDLTTATLLTRGDIRITSLTPFQVIFDPMKASNDEHDWRIVRQWVARSDLYRLYSDVPDLQDRIESAGSREQGGYVRSWTMGPITDMSRELNDDILVFKLFYRQTPTRPNGRYVVCLQDGTVLFDNDYLPYNKIPVFRLVAGEKDSTTFGYSPLNKIVGCQEALNLINSTILSNQNAFGSNIIAVPKGTDISPQSFRGLGILEVSPGMGEPRTLQLCATPAELFNYRNTLIHEMEQMMGVSDVSRGRNLSGSSGANNALMNAISSENSGSFQTNYAELCSEIGTFIVRLLETNITNPRTVAILGDNGPSMVNFSGQDLTGIDRVTVEPMNPMTSSPQGRMMMAQQLMTVNAITPQQYLDIINTGNLNSGLDATKKESIYIRAENDRLKRGSAIAVDPQYDNHMLHLAHHRELLNMPEIRFDTSPQGMALLQAIHAHMLQHEQAMANNNAMNVPPPPVPPMDGQAPSGPPSPPPGISEQSQNAQRLPQPAQPAQPRAA